MTTRRISDLPQPHQQPNRAELVLSEITSHFYHMAEKEFLGWRVEYNRHFPDVASVELYAENRSYLKVRVESLKEDPNRPCPTDINETLRVKALVSDLFTRQSADSPEHFAYLRLDLIVSKWVETHRTHVLDYSEQVTATGTAYHVVYQGPSERIVVQWWVYDVQIETARLFYEAVKSISEEVNGNPSITFPNSYHMVVTATHKYEEEKRSPLFELYVRGYRQDYDAEIPTEKMDTKLYMETRRNYIDVANSRFGGDPGVKLLGHAAWGELEKMGYYPVMVSLHKKPEGNRVHSVFSNAEDKIIVTVDHLNVV